MPNNANIPDMDFRPIEERVLGWAAGEIIPVAGGDKARIFAEMYGAKPVTQPEPEFKFEETVLRSYPTGSRYICNPAPKDTDNDTVILVNGFLDWRSALHFEGWTECTGDDGKYETFGRFTAYRKGEENYIVTEDEDFFKRYVCATEAARALNLLKKEDRITLFQAIADAPSDGYKGIYNAKNPLDFVWNAQQAQFEPLNF